MAPDATTTNNHHHQLPTTNHHQMPTPIRQVTRETLSSRAGAPVLKPIETNLLKPRQTNYLNRLFVTREEVPRLTVTLTSSGSWRGGEQPSRRSSGGWRSCGGRGLFLSTSRLWIRASQHLVVLRDSLQEALDFKSIVGKG